MEAYPAYTLDGLLDLSLDQVNLLQWQGKDPDKELAPSFTNEADLLANIKKRNPRLAKELGLT